MCNLKTEAMDRAGELPLENSMSKIDVESKDQGSAALRGESVAKMQLVPKFAGQFDSHQQWVNKAQSWLKSPPYRLAMCIDSEGRRMTNGGDMARARDEGKFPVRFFWECELVPVSARAADAPSEPSEPQAVQQLRKSLAGWIDEAAALRKSLDQARADLELRALHQKNDAWYWQGDGTDFPESISNSMCIIMRGDQLRALVEAGKSRAADALDSQKAAACADPEDPSEREVLIACLGDDAMTLLRANPDDEMAQTMREAVAMLESDEVVIATLGINSRASSAPVAPIAPDAQAVNTITLTGHQLVAALDLIAPGLPRDADELDNDLTFGVRQHKEDDGIMATGMCCWNDDTDGVLPLDEHPDDADPQQVQSEAIPDLYIGKWSFSADEENFSGEHDSEQNAIAEATAQGYAKFWVGQCVHPVETLPDAQSIGESVIQQADEWAYEECGGDDRVFDLNDDDTTRLGQLVRDFIKREASVQRYGVTNITLHQPDPDQQPVTPSGALADNDA